MAVTEASKAIKESASSKAKWEIKGNGVVSGASDEILKLSTADSDQQFSALGWGAWDEATNGAVASGGLTVKAGDVVSFDYKFKTDDNISYNDFAVYSLGGKAVKLADVKGVGSKGDSGWQTMSFVAETAGDLNFGVFNWKDEDYDSSLSVKNVSTKSEVTLEATQEGFGQIALGGQTATGALELLPGSLLFHASDKVGGNVVDTEMTIKAGATLDLVNAIDLTAGSPLHAIKGGGFKNGTTLDSLETLSLKANNVAQGNLQVTLKEGSAVGSGTDNFQILPATSGLRMDNAHIQTAGLISGAGTSTYYTPFAYYSHPIVVKAAPPDTTSKDSEVFKIGGDSSVKKTLVFKNSETSKPILGDDNDDLFVFDGIDDADDLFQMPNFKTGQDKLNFASYQGIDGMENLSLVEQDGGVLIEASASGEDIVALQDVQVDQLTADHFIFS